MPNRSKLVIINDIHQQQSLLPLKPNKNKNQQRGAKPVKEVQPVTQNANVQSNQASSKHVTNNAKATNAKANSNRASSRNVNVESNRASADRVRQMLIPNNPELQRIFNKASMTSLPNNKNLPG